MKGNICGITVMISGEVRIAGFDGFDAPGQRAALVQSGMILAGGKAVPGP
jgi:hypothetical protein